MTYRPITDIWILARPRLTGGAKYYGAYPLGFVERARALLGVHIDDPVLHICSGMVRKYPYQRRAIGPNDKTLDLDPNTGPDFCQDARKPYPEGFAAHLADPPYSPDDADHYWPGRNKLPTCHDIARLSIKALGIGRRVGILDFCWARPPKNAMEVASISVKLGRGMRDRCYTVLERVA